MSRVHRPITRRPPAEARGAASFYVDPNDADHATHVCHGTSCLLAGADQLPGRLAPEVTWLGTYCLGHCDRSPAVLRPDGHVRTVGHATEGAEMLAGEGLGPAPAEVRSLVSQPILVERAIHGDHSDLARARAAGVYDTLAAALQQPPAAVLATVEQSHLRGRGGAGFPVGAKWRACAVAAGDRRYVVANGDEGDPGAFVDRVLLELDPHTLLEGLALCAYAVGASEGIVFIRAEYPRAAATMERAIVEAQAAGLLGAGVEFKVVRGRGSYVCGEETALLNAIEGRRGEVRLRPPYPAQAGLFGQPTVVNNIETLSTIPWLLRHGAEAFASRGTPSSHGTKALCLNRGFARPGLVEVEFGTPLRTVLDEAAGGRDGQPLAAVLLGGPMGCVVGPEDWDVPVCYRALSDRGLQLGHGGLVALPADTDFPRLVTHWLQFMADESCGRCVPCRRGSQRALGLAEHLPNTTDLVALERWLDTISAGSLCAFGQLIPQAVRQLTHRFRNELQSAAEGVRP